ncbi:MAG: serine/threonine protein kinase [Microthrixaceae bacterium]
MQGAEPPFPRIPGLEITGLLGKGATSRVFLGIQTRFDRPVAVKVLDVIDRAYLAGDLLDNETRMLALLSAHPNILTLYDAGVTDDGHPYLITEYLPAGSLGVRLRTDGPLEAAEVGRIGIHLCGALSTAHLHEVIHGDVKPDNVLIGRTDQPVLGDFGVAGIRTQADHSQTSVLTPLHAAPELLDDHVASTATDVYELGSTLTALVTGNSPVGNATEPVHVILGRLHDGERVGAGREGVPADLLEVLDHATAHQPSERFADMCGFGEALQDLQRASGVQVSEMQVMSEVGVPLNPPRIAALKSSAAELTIQPGNPTGSGDRRLLRTSVLVGLVMVVVATAMWFVLAGRQGGEADSEDGRLDPPTAEESERESPSTTADLPTSDLAGVQPGIALGEPAGPDRSAEIAAKMSDEPLLFAQLPVDPLDMPYYGVALSELPATFSYQAYNSLLVRRRTAGRPFETCGGMMSRPLVVDGLWERRGEWPGGALLVAVAAMGDESMAHELFTALSVEIGVDEDACNGLGAWNVTDYDDYGVNRRDIPGILPAGTDYNVWQLDDVYIGTKSWPQVIRMVMQVEDYVVDMILATDTELPAGDAKVITDIARQVRARLIGG